MILQKLSGKFLRNSSKLKILNMFLPSFYSLLPYAFNKLTTSEICLDSYVFRDLIVHGEKEMNALIYELIN